MASKLERRLDEIYAIGGGPGANRPGYSAEEDEAHRIVGEWMAAAGFEVEVDQDGNLLGRLVGTEPELPEVWSGSHLDSVPQGGRLDGPLGVLGALEALERLGRRRRTLAVVAFRVVRRTRPEERPGHALVAPDRVVADLTEDRVGVGVALDGVATADRDVEQGHGATEHVTAALRDDRVVAGDDVLADATRHEGLTDVVDTGRVGATDEVVVAALAVDGVVTVVALDVEGPVAVKSYTVAGAPSAATLAGQIIYVSDETGGAVLAFSDGTSWRRVTDRSVIA